MRMAAERAEHGRVQVQVQVRMPLLPRRCRVLAGDSDYRVLHGVDVLGPLCEAGGAGERLGNHVNQGFGGRCRPGAPALQGFGGRYRHGAPVVAGVDGSDAYRAEAEPFTAKRSGTG